MKITPMTQGAPMPTADVGGVSLSPDRIARAKAVMTGEALPPAEQVVQEAQEKPSVRKIQMKTQVSTNRHELEGEKQAFIDGASEALDGAADKLFTLQSPTSDVVEPTTPVVEETKPLSPQFAALAKAKRAIQVKEMELAKREEALKTQNPAGIEDYKTRLKADPMGALQEIGVSYEQLTEAILNNQSSYNPELNQLKETVNALKEDITKQFSERDSLQEQQVLSQMRRDADALTREGEQFEAIRQAKAQGEVVDLIHRTWKETGELLDLSEAAQLVENQLIEEAIPFAKIKKVQSRLAPPPQEQVVEPQSAPAPKPGTKIMRTLTNRDNARPTATDRRSRALAAWNGSLRKG